MNFTNYSSASNSSSTTRVEMDDPNAIVYSFTGAVLSMLLILTLYFASRRYYKYVHQQLTKKQVFALTSGLEDENYSMLSAFDIADMKKSRSGDSILEHQLVPLTAKDALLPSARRYANSNRSLFDSQDVFKGTQHNYPYVNANTVNGMKSMEHWNTIRRTGRGRAENKFVSVHSQEPSLVYSSFSYPHTRAYQTADEEHHGGPSEAEDTVIVEPPTTFMSYFHWSAKAPVWYETAHLDDPDLLLGSSSCTSTNCANIELSSLNNGVGGSGRDDSFVSSSQLVQANDVGGLGGFVTVDMSTNTDDVPLGGLPQAPPLPSTPAPPIALSHLSSELLVSSTVNNVAGSAGTEVNAPASQLGLGLGSDPPQLPCARLTKAPVSSTTTNPIAVPPVGECSYSEAQLIDLDYPV